MRKTEIGLYVHVPFCLAKCVYCDFVSYPYEERSAERYLRALDAEIDLWSGKLGETAVKSIYVGGGTPTCLGGRALSRLLRALRNRFSVLPGAEVTVEINPETAAAEMLEALLHEGVNRLSVGMQTADDALLRFLGRRHTAEEAAAMVITARRAGFDNVNLDLIFGIPGQDLPCWERTLGEAVALEPEHLSAYGLEIHHETPLGAAVAGGSVVPCREEEERAMYLRVIDFLSAHGYAHYEISNFARPGKESRHNRLYWEGEPYLGLGPAAHSYLDGCRWSNAADLSVYCENLDGHRLPVTGEVALNEEDEMAEAMFMGLRLIEGISCARFAARFGRKAEKVFAGKIEDLIAQDLLQREGDRLRLTAKALPVANVVFRNFV
jgi:oxygen-independent coproporphyrinogen-3 oxidase